MNRKCVGTLNGSGEMAIPLVLADGLACGPDLMRIVSRGRTPESDRRRRLRVAVSWRMHVFRPNNGAPLEAKTKDISADAFYCFIPEALAVGDYVRCVVEIPAHQAGHSGSVMYLRCHARVLRVDALGGTKYGMACLIEDYVVTCSATENGGAAHVAPSHREP